MLEPSADVRFTIVDVDYSDSRARELRRSMDIDTEHRYGGAGAEPAELTAKRARALAVAARDVRATLLAVAADGSPIGHAVLRRLRDDWELKRLFVHPDARGSGVAKAILAEAERIAATEGARRLILQTGDKQPEAIELYRRSGYSPIPVYEPYRETMPDSLCFEKPLVGARV